VDNFRGGLADLRTVLTHRFPPEGGAEEKETTMVNAAGGGGGGSRFTVDADAISQHGGSIGSIARDIESKMTLMQRQLQALQGNWQGGASNQYAALHQDWERQQRNVKDSLDRISRALGKTANDYRMTEQSAKASFTPI
jgi:WXG100 family type VII secretion target